MKSKETFEISDTPRTDEADMYDYVTAVDFGRMLERELNAAKAELAVLKAKFKAAFEMPHDLNGLCPDSVAGMDSRDPDCAACRALMEVFDAT